MRNYNVCETYRGPKRSPYFGGKRAGRQGGWVSAYFEICSERSQTNPRTLSTADSGVECGGTS